MRFIGVISERLPSLNYKAYFWGQHSDNLSSWRGCNYRKICIPGQPTRGYTSLAECEEFILKQFPSEEDAEQASPPLKNGSHLREGYGEVRHCFDWKRRLTNGKDR